MLTIQYAKNPVYSNVEGTSVNLIVKFVEMANEMQFGATSWDPESYGIELYNNAVAGMYGPVAPFVPPIPTAQENKQTAIGKLQETDWTDLSDVSNPQVSNPYLLNKAEFLSYRSAIRGIAVNPVAGNIQWPVKPNEQWSS